MSLIELSIVLKALLFLGCVVLLIYIFNEASATVKIITLILIVLFVAGLVGFYYVSETSKIKYSNGYIQNTYFGTACSKLSEAECKSSNHCTCIRGSKFPEDCYGCEEVSNTKNQSLQNKN
ncbi:MAG: hypothetical protein WCW27_06095 [Patescibacteria group bacterium]|jgi:membrane-bound ClpP family serine protease